MNRGVSYRFFLLALCWVLSLAPDLLANERSQLNLRVGLSNFRGANSDAQHRLLVDYLGRLVAAARTDKRFLADVELEAVTGNSYQLLSWLRRGEIDIAVVSSFTGSLLEGTAAARRLLGVAAPGSESCSGRWPEMAARGSAGWLEKPVDEYTRFIKDSYHRISQEVIFGDQADETKGLLIFESHLSSAAFMAPLLLTQEILHIPLSRLQAEKRSQVEEKFWESFFTRARFRTAEGDDGPPESEAIFYFSDKANRPVWPSHSVQWQSYPLASLDGGSSIPADVLVITQDALDRLAVGTRGLMDDCSRTSGNCEQFRQWLLQVRPADGRLSSHFCQLDTSSVTREAHQNHWRAIKALFQSENDDDRNRFQKWYLDEKYDFSLEDILGFLRQDQRNSGDPSLALVLPGGGVKSAYQARVLDELYEKHLANTAEIDTAAIGNRMQVRNIVGTSGGAMMSLLAARLEPGQADLTEIWQEQLSSSADIFPFFSIPRWASFFLLVLEFSVLLSILAGIRRLQLTKRKIRIRTTRTPWLVLTVSALALVLLPLCLALVWSGDLEGRLRWPAAIYMMMITFIFIGLGLSFDDSKVSFGGKNQAGTSSRSPLRGVSEVGLWLSGSLVSVILISHCPQPWNFLQILAPIRSVGPTLLSFGFLLFVCFFFARVCYVDRLTCTEVVVRWRSFLCVLAYVGACYAILGLLVFLDITTFLEMTTLFWLSLLLVGLGVFTIIATAVSATQRKVRPLHQSLRYLSRPIVRGFAIMKPKTTLTILFAFGLIWWYICLGSALYSSEHASKLFEKVIKEKVAGSSGGTDSADIHIRLKTNLVVTTSALSGFHCEDDPNVGWQPPGDHYFYFCLDRKEDCRTKRANRLWPQGARLSNLVDSVFASGSPFPVFPPHRVALTPRCRVELVDGGYAHLVPLEGAKHVGARQVLVIHSQPELEGAQSLLDPHPNFPSRLAILTGRILPFLFERSQELDRSVASRMMVAQLTPTQLHGKFPQLTDFREHIIDRMIMAAESDLSKPMGRIVSWGRPPVGQRVPLGD